jgi:hypothetical protein
MELQLDDIFEDVAQEIVRHYIDLSCCPKSEEERKDGHKGEYRGPLLELGLVSKVWRAHTIKGIVATCKARIKECTAVFAEWQLVSPYHLKWIYRRMRAFLSLVKIHHMLLIHLCLPDLPIEERHIDSTVPTKLSFVIHRYRNTTTEAMDEQSIITRKYMWLLNVYQSWGVTPITRETLGWYDLCFLLRARTPDAYGDSYMIQKYYIPNTGWGSQYVRHLKSNEILTCLLRAVVEEKRGEPWAALCMIVPYHYILQGILNDMIEPNFWPHHSPNALPFPLALYYGIPHSYAVETVLSSSFWALLELYAIDPEIATHRLFPTFRQYLEGRFMKMNPGFIPTPAIGRHLNGVDDSPVSERLTKAVAASHWREVFMDPMDLLMRSKRTPDIYKPRLDPAVEIFSLAQWRFLPHIRKFTQERCDAMGRERTVGLYRELVGKLRKMIPLLDAKDFGDRMLEAFIQEQNRAFIEDS